MFKLFSRFLDSNERQVGRMQPAIDKINALEPEFEKFSNAELKDLTRKFKERITNGSTLDELLPDAFAAVREAAKRAIGQRHFDVQLIGGMVLHEGKIAEMKTGEGKTLVATLPLYLNSLTGQGVHLITVNDFLAKFHAQWMGPIYEALGVSVASIGHDQSWIYRSENREVEDQTWKNLWPISRKDAYNADITYGTNNEFGFDYLRDNMAPSLAHVMQRKQHYAIVDEVDSILIDEARTPLIISAPSSQAASLYATFAQLIKKLKKGDDYTVDEKERGIVITDDGIKKMEQWLGVTNLYTPENVTLVHHLDEALKAQGLFQKDKDYVVKDGEIIIVDEFTGRMLPGRRYSEGLHQAIEAKEGVEVKQESITMATISFQNLFRLYEKLAGMTGTALTEAEEFYKIYKLEAVGIPTHRPMVRLNLEDRIYKNEVAKYNAVVAEVKRINDEGRPILIGTISIGKNELLSKLLKKQGIKHELLNAKNHEREAKTIAQAGRKAKVTLATNIAGRGVDIILGGTPPEANEALGRDDRKLSAWQKDHDEVVALGGLHVIGTERHESRRIDNQLRGRAGRQGDPGSSIFFVSMEDDLMRIFGGDRMKGMMDRLGLPDDQPIEHGLVSKSIEQAQKKVEGHNFDIRKHLVEYDDVANKQREVIYRKRRAILEGKGKNRDSQQVQLHDEIMDLVGPKEAPLGGEQASLYGKKYQSWGEAGPQVEQAVYLRTIDNLWVEHLNNLDRLREGIGLRGYGQKDPLVEYKHEAFSLFEQLLRAIEDQTIDVLLRMEVTIQAQSIEPPKPAPVIEQGAVEEPSGQVLEEEKPSVSSSEPAISSSGVSVTVRKKGEVIEQSQGGGIISSVKVGRNDPCPCGSGRKYKKCHGA